MGTHWLGEDYLRPLPSQPIPLPYRPDSYVGIPFGGILDRNLSKRELLTAEQYAALRKRLEDGND